MKQVFSSKTYFTLAFQGNCVFPIWQPMLMILPVSQVSSSTFVCNDADFAIGVYKISALYIFTCISDQVLEWITTCSFKNNYKASSVPCTFNLAGLTLFPLGIWLSSWNVMDCKYIILIGVSNLVIEIIRLLLTIFYIFSPDSHGLFAQIR